MKFLLPALTLGVAILLNGCADAPSKPATAQQGLKFTYPTAQRNVIALSGPEREFMLNEMRFYLDMLWVTSDALSHNDFDTVAKVARSRIPAMSYSQLPATLESKLPKEFLAYWKSTHALVDELALTAENSRSQSETLRQLATVLRRCNECHAIFQFQTR
jgi:hypothetical protein